MVRRVVRIVGGAALTVAGAVGLVLLMMALAPGDPIDLIPGGEAIRPQLEAEWGLDQPLAIRWFQTLARMAQGDLGTSISYRPGAPVLDVVGAASLRSLGWLLTALLLAAAQSVALGERGPGLFVGTSLRPLDQHPHILGHEPELLGSARMVRAP